VQIKVIPYGQAQHKIKDKLQGNTGGKIIIIIIQ
jgi:hypothetical protein